MISRPALRSSSLVAASGGGEPLTTMTADNITAERLDSLKALLETAVDTMDDLADQVEFSLIDPAEAAAIVNETIQNLVNESR